jgi:hypothetical protein
MLEHYENEIERDQEKSASETAPETEIVKLDITKQEHADMVIILKALNGRGLQPNMPSAFFPEKVEQFTAVSIAKA